MPNPPRPRLRCSAFGKWIRGPSLGKAEGLSRAASRMLRMQHLTMERKWSLEQWERTS